MSTGEEMGERMYIICLKSKQPLNLLDTVLTIGERELEFCGLARQELRDGRLWQWWIVMDA